MLQRVKPQACQADARGYRSRRAKETAPKANDPQRAEENWTKIVLRGRRFNFKIDLLQTLVSMNEDWFETRQFMQKGMEKLGYVLGVSKHMRKSLQADKKKKEKEILDQGFEGTRILRGFMFGLRQKNSLAQGQIKKFEECAHPDSAIVDSGNASQLKCFRCKDCGGRWEKLKLDDMSDMAYLKEIPRGTHLVKFGKRHLMKTYYQVSEDKEYCRWLKGEYRKNVRNGDHNNAMFEHLYQWLMMFEEMKDSYPTNHSRPCPKITEEGWELIGEELKCFGSLEDPDQSDDDEPSSGPPRGEAEHHDISTDAEMMQKASETDKPTKVSPEAKRTKGTASHATGSTQGSRGNQEAASRKRLPESDSEKGA